MSNNCLPFANTWVHRPMFWWGSCYLSFFVCCLVLCICVVFVSVLCIVCPLQRVSLDCPFLIAPSVFIIFAVIDVLSCNDGQRNRSNIMWYSLCIALCHSKYQLCYPFICNLIYDNYIEPQLHMHIKGLAIFI